MSYSYDCYKIPDYSNYTKFLVEDFKSFGGCSGFGLIHVQSVNLLLPLLS